MAEEVVVREQLTSEMIKAGAELIRALDRSHLRINGAFWFYVADSEIWRLILVSEEVDKHGPRKVYGDVQRVLLQTPGKRRLRLSDITVMESNAELVSSLRKAIKIGPGISGTRFSRNVINGYYIEDSYIYRLI